MFSVTSSNFLHFAGKFFVLSCCVNSEKKSYKWRSRESDLRDSLAGGMQGTILIMICWLHVVEDRNLHLLGTAHHLNRIILSKKGTCHLL